MTYPAGRTFADKYLLMMLGLFALSHLLVVHVWISEKPRDTTTVLRALLTMVYFGVPLVLICSLVGPAYALLRWKWIGEGERTIGCALPFGLAFGYCITMPVILSILQWQVSRM